MLARSCLAKTLEYAIRLLGWCARMAGSISGALNTFKRRLHSIQINLQYKTHKNDLFIATYPKSGTTWMQMIIYQITTPGNMDLHHITDFAPYFESQLKKFQESRDSGKLRVFKTHLRYRDVLKGSGRYIYLVRDGLDVAVSYYYHLQTKQLRGEPFAKFLSNFLVGKIGGGSWFTHVSEWISNREGLDMLVLRYEDLVNDLEGCIRRVAAFCDVQLSEPDLQRVLHNCSFEFMRQHEAKFDPFQSWQGDPEDRHFIRRGVVGQWRTHVTEEMLTAFTKEFDHHMKGCIFDEYRNKYQQQQVEVSPSKVNQNANETLN